MTENRDVLAELDSIEEYLKGLIGTEPKYGQAQNVKRLAAETASFRACAQNIVELNAEHEAGVTYKERLERSYGCPLTAEQVLHLIPDAVSGPSADAQIAELQRQLAEARGQLNG